MAKKATKKKATKKPATKRTTVRTKPAVSEKDLKELEEITARRLDLQRERDVLKRREDAIKAQLVEHVEAKGGKKKEVKLGRYLLAMVAGKTYVSWKNEFIRVAGTEEAERVTADTPAKLKLEIKAV